VNTAWRELTGLIVSPRETLEGFCARQTLRWSLTLGTLGYYLRTLPMSEALLGPIGGPVTYLAANCLFAVGWMVMLTAIIHLATRVLGHRRGRWRDLLLLWGYTQVPGIALIALSGSFVASAPQGWRHELGVVSLALAFGAAGLLFLWALVLQFQALRICYGLSGRLLLGVIGVALVMYNLAVWAEFTFVDDRARVPPVARRAMSSTLCPLMATRPDASLAFDRLAYRMRAPRRGEIVGFLPSGWAEPPVSALLSAQVRFIGRVVGVPGDEVEVRKGKLYVNGQPHAEPYREDREGIDVGATRLLGGQYFVLGDNRNVPVQDYHGGIVTQRDLRGRLTAVGKRKWVFLVDSSRC